MPSNGLFSKHSSDKMKGTIEPLGSIILVWFFPCDSSIITFLPCLSLPLSFSLHNVERLSPLLFVFLKGAFYFFFYGCKWCISTLVYPIEKRNESPYFLQIPRREPIRHFHLALICILVPSSFSPHWRYGTIGVCGDREARTNSGGSYVIRWLCRLFRLWAGGQQPTERVLARNWPPRFFVCYERKALAGRIPCWPCLLSLALSACTSTVQYQYSDHDIRTFGRIQHLAPWSKCWDFGVFPSSL